MTTYIEIVGLASGRGSTAEAARGALCIRTYPTWKAAQAAEKDWLTLLHATKKEGQP